MPLGLNDAIESARVLLYAVDNRLSESVELALIEQVVAGRAVRSDNVRAIGHPIPPTNVTNMEEGQVRWSRAYCLRPDIERVIAPIISDWFQFKSFDLMGMDPEDGKLLFLAVGVRPTMLDFESRAGQYVRQNYTAICRAVLIGEQARRGL